MLEFHSASRRDEPPADQARNPDWSKIAPLLQTYRAAVIQFLYRMVHDAAVAEELALEVFLRLYRSGVRGGVTPDGTFATRLFRIATDLALRKLRNGYSQSTHERFSDGETDLISSVASLPDRQRAAVLMHRYHRMDSGQIAKVLNCRESAARSLLYSSYETLRRRLASCNAASRNPNWPEDCNWIGQEMGSGTI